MTDMEYTLDERVIRKPTHDTPEAGAMSVPEMHNPVSAGATEHTHDTPVEIVGNCPECDAPIGDSVPGCVHWPTTHDTPEAARVALIRVLNDLWQRGWLNIPDGYSPEVAVTQFLAAMPGWTLVPRVATADWTGSGKRADAAAEVSRLRAAIQAVLDDAESQHPGGWGPDVTTVGILRAALAPTEEER